MSVALGTAAALGAAGLTMAGSLGSTIYGTERNISNANYQAALNREFEEYMSSSSYQRAIADMEAAGLNPAAVGASMAGASTPSSAAAMGNYGHGSDFSHMFSSAVAAAMAKDKNMTRKITQEMRDETALQVQRLRNEGMVENEIQKKAMDHIAYRKKKDNGFEYKSSDVSFDEL